jgi:hypothetical protein
VTLDEAIASEVAARNGGGSRGREDEEREELHFEE